MKKILIICLMFLAATLFSQTVLKMGLFPIYNAKTMIRLFAPIAQKLEEDTGYSIQLLSSPDKADFNNKTLNGYFDISWTNNSCYQEAREKGIICAVARGTPAFRGIVMVRKDSGIDSIEQLKGKKIGAIGPYSLAGYLFLKNDLIDAGIDINRDCLLEFNLKPEAIPFRVHDGVYDAGVFSEDTLIGSPLFESIRDDMKIIHSSIPIPHFPFTVKTDMDPVLRNSIQRSLNGISHESETFREILDDLNLEKIMAVDDSDYDEFVEFYRKSINYDSVGNQEKK
ncbi:phosphate/phosphite/phosphonate ABC transporter substrate-binding protein [Spirochaeta isovalerica]|uniref:Phosphonate transport system substrate-binding protein n=1 Tax=Spirochaeta isovalerica TaxID=150 RepID=A0A841R5T5_9SPIO|nr:phosphate/phosphite/phosphonate ABC transporter substrate-binding protein [Spirochaeta isovalerica]MBB6479215.1 phosphonate transport system substrate-binding protein [Spirochaeta isovalerica]